VTRPRILRAFRLALRRRDHLEHEVRDEIEHHVALTVESLVASGLTAEEARAEALRRLGRAPSIDDVHRQLVAAAQRRENRMRLHERLEAVADDTRYAMRQLRRSPGFAIAVVLTFALGIGANATMVGLVDRLLLRAPAGVDHAERIMALTVTWPHEGAFVPHQPTFPWSTYKALRAALRGPGMGVEDVGASIYAPIDISLGLGEGARAAKAVLVSASFFPTLGARPELGRFFLPDEDVEPVGTPVIVISHALWKRAYGGARTVLGQEVVIGTRRYTIVGVAAKGFTGTELGAVDLWMPVSSAEGLRFAGEAWATTRDATWIRVIARLAPGADTAPVVARATGVNRETGEPRMARLNATIVATPLPAAMRSSGQSTTGRVAALLAAVSGLVLLIACANVANLLLARALRRRHEVAVRLALGVTRARLVLQLLTESILLAMLGGVAALIVVQWAGTLVRHLVLGDLGWTESPVDRRVLAYTFGAAMFTGIIAGLVPAIQATRHQLTDALKPAGTRDGTARQFRTRTALLVGQAALAVVLLVGAALFVRSMRNLRALPLGMDPDRVLLVTMDLGPLGMKGREVDALFRRMEEQVRTVRGVRGAAGAMTVAGRGSFMERLTIPGRDSLPEAPGGGPFINAVRPDYFAVMGTRILRGRGFTDGDELTPAQAAIVNETFARLAWPGEDAIGKCVRIGPEPAPCTTIVGIAENGRRQDWIEEENLYVYRPVPRVEGYWMNARLLVVRVASGDPNDVIPDVRRAIQLTAPNLPYAEIRPLGNLYASELRPWRLGATMFGIFGTLAVILAAIGLYGVVSLSVTQRTRELGVRIALGAPPGSVVRLVMRQGVLVVTIGAALGIAAAIAAGPTIEPLLFRVPAREPMVYAGVVALLFVVAIVASVIPSWRATRVDPATALRAE
jgi:predicted permease